MAVKIYWIESFTNGARLAAEKGKVRLDNILCSGGTEGSLGLVFLLGSGYI